MELIPTNEKPKNEKAPEVDLESKPNNLADAQDSTLLESQGDAAFLSASHEFAVKQYEGAAGSEDSAAMAKAEKVAHSMGFSQSYDKNPFNIESEKELAKAYELGERQQERMIEEARIGKDDKDMDYDN